MIDKRAGYNEAHIIQALFLISQRPVGRMNLMGELKLGEASVKTLLKNLKDNGMIISTRRGHELTSKGKAFLTRILKMLEKPKEIDISDYTVSKENYAIVVKKASNKVKMGVEQRDEAIKVGADGATTFIFKSGKLWFPGTNEKANENLTEKVSKLFELKDGDVVIIGSAKNKYKAREAAIMAALSLL